VYDMYPWNQPADPSPAVRPRPARRPAWLSRTGRATDATQALQVALDRRDNGGESAAAAGQ
jgi:hypothetical protein